LGGRQVELPGLARFSQDREYRSLGCPNRLSQRHDNRDGVTACWSAHATGIGRPNGEAPDIAEALGNRPCRRPNGPVQVGKEAVAVSAQGNGRWPGFVAGNLVAYPFAAHLHTTGAGSRGRPAHPNRGEWFGHARCNRDDQTTHGCRHKRGNQAQNRTFHGVHFPSSSSFTRY
jgi:hypothetical protein